MRGDLPENLSLTFGVEVEGTSVGTTFSVSVSGPGVVIGADECDLECLSELVFPGGRGDEIQFSLFEVVDPDFRPDNEHFSGVARGHGFVASVVPSFIFPLITLPADRSDMLRFWGETAVTEPSTPAKADDEFDSSSQLRIEFRHGLEYTPGNPVENESIFENGPGDFPDASGLLYALFINTNARLPCEGSLGEGSNRVSRDSNGDERVDLADAVFLLDYLFLGGPPPVRGVTCWPIPGCSNVCEAP